MAQKLNTQKQVKLRIRGNSLRLRLSRSDLGRLESEGLVEEEIVLGTSADQHLIYRLKKIYGNEWNTEMMGAELTIGVPATVAETWISSEEVGIGIEEKVGQGRTLQILIERDFTCLKRREGEDDRDTFEHPAAVKTC